MQCTNIAAILAQEAAYTTLILTYPLNVPMNYIETVNRNKIS